MRGDDSAGGWKNTQTLVTCYQQPDADTLRRTLDEPRKLRDRGLLDDAPAGAIAREPVEKRCQKRHPALVG